MIITSCAQWGGGRVEAGSLWCSETCRSKETGAVLATGSSGEAGTRGSSPGLLPGTRAGVWKLRAALMPFLLPTLITTPHQRSQPCTGKLDTQRGMNFSVSIKFKIKVTEMPLECKLACRFLLRRPPEGEGCSSLPPRESRRYWIKSHRPTKAQTGAAAALQTHKQQFLLSDEQLVGRGRFLRGGRLSAALLERRKIAAQKSNLALKFTLDAKASTQMWGQ